MFAQIQPCPPTLWRPSPSNEGRRSGGDPIIHVLDIPFRNQASPTSCGTCCTSLVIEARTGRRVSEKMLCEQYGLVFGKDGTTYDLMARMIADYDAGRPKPVERVSAAILVPALARGAPMIAGLATRGQHHAVIIRGIVIFETGVAHVLINDPGGLGMPVFAPLGTVDRALSGGLLIEP